MKRIKFIYLLALAALLLNVSCAKDDEPALSGDKIAVTFLAHLPETLDSRAIGDGSKANELFFWVFDENDHEYEELRQRNVDFDQNNVSRVTVYLTPGHTYKFAFWAQRKNITAYDPQTADLIKISYEAAPNNDEFRDAFYGWIPDLYVDNAGNITRDIVLSRRLAQLNVGISQEGAAEAKAAGIDLSEYDSEISIVGMSLTNPAGYKGFNSMTGNPITNNPRTYNQKTIDYALAPMPNELLSAANKKWVYLSLSYFQPKVDVSTLVTVNLTLRHKTSDKELSFSFPNVGVKGTERTNILIRSITEWVDFDVIIDENFDNLDNNIFFPVE